jgi:hypothetical protein
MYNEMKEEAQTNDVNFSEEALILRLISVQCKR